MCILYIYVYLGKYTMYAYMGSCKQFLKTSAVGWVCGSSGFKCLSPEVVSWFFKSQHFAGICTSGVQFFPLPAASELVKLFQIVCMKHLIFNLRYSDVTSVNPRAWNLEAWFSMFSFATLASNLELEQVADLLMKMLQLCHVEPTPELRGGLRSCK